MTLLAMSFALAAAVLHASWSLMSKRLSQYDAVCFIWLASLGSFVAYAPLVVWATEGLRVAISTTQAVFMVGSIVINLGYLVVTQYGYRIGELSFVYPIARGTGPVLSTIGGFLWLDQPASSAALAGLCAVIVGVMALGWLARPAGAHAMAFRGYCRVFAYALLSGTTIAGYTLWDQHAVGPLAISPLLLNWVDDAGRVILLGPVVLTRRVELGKLWNQCRWMLLGAATIMPLPYLLFLFSLRWAPASVVSPVREVSVLLVVVLSGSLFTEKQWRPRLLISALVVAGLALLATSA